MEPEKLWRSLRALPGSAQVVAWLLLWWALVPLLIWKSSWSLRWKAGLTAAFLIALVLVAEREPTIRVDPANGRASARPDDEPDPQERDDSSREQREVPAPRETSRPSRGGSKTVVANKADGRSRQRVSPEGAASRVIRVIDGDTVEVAFGSKTVGVRLIGIDTPETVHPTVGVECYGRQASAFTKSRLEGRNVRVEYDIERTDRYGRTLAYLWLEGRLFNRLLVRRGYAQVSTYPPNVKYVEAFVDAERAARRSGAGLWSAGCSGAEQGDRGERPDPQPAAASGKECDPNYAGTCVPKVSHDLDCADLAGPVQVVGADRHGFDADADGFGCESN